MGNEPGSSLNSPSIGTIVHSVVGLDTVDPTLFGNPTHCSQFGNFLFKNHLAVGCGNRHGARGYLRRRD